MLIGERIRQLREAKKLSQGDIEKRTGLSRVENCHTVPAIETIEKYARALEVPIYQLFYECEQPAKVPKLPKGKSEENLWGGSGKDARMLWQFRRQLSRMDEKDRRLLLQTAQQMARRSK